MENASPDVPPENEAVTQFRASIARGETVAAEEIQPLVYNELHNLARARLARESPGQSLQATALVHEAYLRLVGSGPDVAWEGRGHFFAAAAEAMRRILVEKARRARRRRHGGGLVRVDLDQAVSVADDESEETLAIHEALDTLAAEMPVAAELVKLKYFAGLTTERAAQVQGVSLRTANRHWAFARAWLADALGGGASQ
jgi:RNA polymerase sigma factor (TIGR02999 family)